MNEKERAQRNLSPHSAACVAMALYGARYAAQSGGSMDFWDSLNRSEKRICADVARRVRNARPYNGIF